MKQETEFRRTVAGPDTYMGGRRSSVARSELRHGPARQCFSQSLTVRAKNHELMVFVTL